MPLEGGAAVVVEGVEEEEAAPVTVLIAPPLVPHTEVEGGMGGVLWQRLWQAQPR